MSVQRYLRWFNKRNESFAGEYPFSCELKELQLIFSVNSDNPMYDCWPVSQENYLEIERLTGYTIQLEKFDYFVEADAE